MASQLEVNSGGQDKIHSFDIPSAWEFIELSARYDDYEARVPPRTYLPAINPERQLADVTSHLKDAFGDHLLFIGLTGSRTENSSKPNTDLDIISIVDDDKVSSGRVLFEGDLKIVSAGGLRKFIEIGYPLIISQFRKAQVLYERDERLNETRNLKPIPEIAIPFLIAKSKFNEQSVDLYKLMSDRLKGTILYSSGLTEAAFLQLAGSEQDNQFQYAMEVTNSDKSKNSALWANYYAKIGLNKMFHSISELFQAVHVRQEGDILDIEPLIVWAQQIYPNAGLLLRDIYSKRKACYKNGEPLSDTEFNTIREAIRTTNPALQRKVLSDSSTDNIVYCN